MAFKVYLTPRTPRSSGIAAQMAASAAVLTFDDEASYDIIAGGAIKIIKGDGSVAIYSPHAWSSVQHDGNNDAPIVQDIVTG